MPFERSCPGSRTIKDPKPEYVNCKRCGTELEIWSDEAKVTCPKCHALYFKEQNLTCIEWCSFAKDCVGEETYNRLMADHKPSDGADRDQQIAEAKARLKAKIEAKACRIGGEMLGS
jgi:DNA-directed RNA polymerase subunit RPC12/RpoP